MFILSLEDEKSARMYFAEIARQRREKISVIFARHLGTDPGNVVEAAVRAAADTEYDEVWCVFDTEGPHHAARRPQALNALDRARQLKYDCAVSNPCWEFWLLLHFENSERSYPNCAAVLRDLGEHVKDYDKGVPCFADLEGGISEAIQRARRMYQTRCERLERGPVDCNPCTQVYRLVERLVSG